MPIRKNPNRQKAEKRTVGRPATITEAVVKRVARLVAKGVPLKYALHRENPSVKEDAWHKAIQHNPNYSTLYERQRAEFVEAACNRLVSERDPANLRWILERRHSEFFSKSAETLVVGIGQTTISGVPDDVLERMRVLAREQAKATS